MKGIPQILVVAIYAMSYGIRVNEVSTGKRPQKELMTATLSVILMMGLLWWGGFFSWR